MGLSNLCLFISISKCFNAVEAQSVSCTALGKCNKNDSIFDLTDSQMLNRYQKITALMT